MKSLLISRVYFPPQVGGISRIMERLAATLGPDRLCCLTGVPEEAAGPRVAGARVYRAPRIFLDRRRIVRATAWARTMGRILVRERPRAVLLGSVDDGPYGLWLRRWVGLPYAVYAHGNEICEVLSDPGRRSLSRTALHGAARVIAVSRFTAGLVERAGVPPARIQVAPPGCDVDTLRPVAPDPRLRARLLGLRAGDRVILTTGNLVARKGHDLVIRALADLRAAVPAVSYLIVGDGPARAGLERLAAEVGVTGQVIFAGRVPDADLPGLYALADVFVMASRERPDANDVEGFGLVFLEAGACGKPSIGGRSGGIPEAITEGITGLLVDPESPQDLAKALGRILTEPGLAERMGREALTRVRRDFTWERAAERVDGILRSLRDRHEADRPPR